MSDNILEIDVTKTAVVFRFKTYVVNDTDSYGVSDIALYFHACTCFHLCPQSEVFFPEGSVDDGSCRRERLE